jgi:hypothetical protein
MFLVDVETLDKQLCEGVNLLTKDYRDDIDINLREIKYFHAYIKQSNSIKGHLCHQNLYQVIFQDKIQWAFHDVEVILWLFLSPMVTAKGRGNFCS